MALRIWGRAVFTALGVGALVGAGQLGVADGLGIVRFDRSFDAATGNQWNAQLAWVSWFATLAAVAGAATAAGVLRRHSLTASIAANPAEAGRTGGAVPGRPPGVGTRIMLALCGGIGAGAVIPLTLRPARAAELTQSINPELVVALAAGLGAVAGILVAVAVLSLRPLAWHLATVGTALWLAALVPAARSLGADGPDPVLRLGVPQWTAQPTDSNRLLDSLTMPALALVAGAVLAAVARWRREPALAAAANGAAGAAPLALAYLIAGPGLNRDLTDQMAPYLGALIAVPAGLLGSLLLTLLIRRPSPGTPVDRTPAPDATAGHAAGAGGSTAAAPPGRTSHVGSASVPAGSSAAAGAGRTDHTGAPVADSAGHMGSAPSAGRAATAPGGMGAGTMGGVWGTERAQAAGGAPGAGGVAYPPPAAEVYPPPPAVYPPPPAAGRGEPEPLEPTHIIPPVTVAEPSQQAEPPRVSGTARVPRRDIPVQDEGYLDWVSGLGSDDPPPPPRRAQGDPLPRRTPGQRFPADA